LLGSILWKIKGGRARDPGRRVSLKGKLKRGKEGAKACLANAKECLEKATVRRNLKEKTEKIVALIVFWRDSSAV